MLPPELFFCCEALPPPGAETQLQVSWDKSLNLVARLSESVTRRKNTNSPECIPRQNSQNTHTCTWDEHYRPCYTLASSRMSTYCTYRLHRGASGWLRPCLWEVFTVVCRLLPLASCKSLLEHNRCLVRPWRLNNRQLSRLIRLQGLYCHQGWADKWSEQGCCCPPASLQRGLSLTFSFQLSPQNVQLC